MAENFDSTMRRLPVYLLLDCSGSMQGEPLQAVQMGIRSLIAELKGNPQALETCWLSIITFSASARQAVPLTEIGLFQEPTLEANGTTALGEALKLLMDCIEREVRKTTADQKGDWKPLVFIMTDGLPTDSWEGHARELRKRRPGNIIACAAGPDAEDDVLKRITEVVVRLQNVSPGTLSAFMKWVSASVTTMSKSVQTYGEQAVKIPDLPKDGGIVLVP
jgi:uncharacterized protein YegL